MNNDITLVKDWLTPMIIAGSVMLAGIIIQRLVILYFRAQAKKEHWKGAIVIISSLRGMIILISLLLGIYFGLANSPLPPSTILIVEKLHKTLIVLILTIVVARVLTGLMKAYTGREEGTRRSISLFNTVINIVVYCIGLLIMLGAAGISITPIITALGVGGLAVALALQDTLSNLFAGIHITVARTIKAGDYVMLSSGEEGTVNDITWRSTTLLTQSDNLVVIPNSKLAGTIVTNYSLPTKNMSVSIVLGVSYDSDLEKVERITLEVATAVMKELGVEDAKPSFRYKEFGNSSVNFGVGVTVHDFKQQYLMKHNLIKSLYKRYKQEGIDIPFPVSTVIVKGGPHESPR